MAGGGERLAVMFPVVCLMFCTGDNDCSWLNTYSLSAFTTACKATDAAELLLLCLLDLLIGDSRWSDAIEAGLVIIWFCDSWGGAGKVIKVESMTSESLLSLLEPRDEVEQLDCGLDPYLLLGFANLNTDWVLFSLSHSSGVMDKNEEWGFSHSCFLICFRFILFFGSETSMRLNKSRGIGRI